MSRLRRFVAASATKLTQLRRVIYTVIAVCRRKSRDIGSGALHCMKPISTVEGVRRLVRARGRGVVRAARFGPMWVFLMLLCVSEFRYSCGVEWVSLVMHGNVF